MMTEKEFTEKYLAHFTQQQLDAVKAADGPILLLAVPGSGKTTVLVHRLGYMVCCCGIDPASILTMTYTVAATREMKQRYAGLFGQQTADAMEFRTINGVSAKIIEYYGKNHGRSQVFRLLDNEGELIRIVGQLYQEVMGEYATESTIKDIRTGITYVKNMMLSESEIKNIDVGIDKFPEIYRRYCAKLRDMRAMDYDDQMVYALMFLQKVPAVLEHFQERFRYICVDESQDTSKIQHAIIKLLAEKNNNIFMVGDEDQSIYGFRAAYPEALMNFESDYPGARVLLMEQNFRSTDQIIGLANRFVAKNRFRREKTIQPTQGEGLAVQRVTAVDRATQYQYLYQEARSVERETAVLFRNNDSALPLIDMFERNKVPYNCRNFDATFFSHRIVNDIRNITQIYYKFGSPISKKAATFACEKARKTGKDILTELLGYPELAAQGRDKVHDLMDILPGLPKDNAGTALNRIWNDLQYRKYVEGNKLDTGKLFVLQMLSRYESDAAGLLRRLDELQAVTQTHQNSPSAKFILSTIHSSKGLEYDRVFLLDVLDGVLPSKIEDEDSEENDIRLYEEERRLYYVGMTRARRELYLFSCQDRASRFTDEALSALPEEIVDKDDVFSFLHGNLCGKLFRSRDKGTGHIAAQCGDRFLVEYKSREVELLLAAEMMERRDTTVRYGAPKPIIGRKPVKRPPEKVNSGIQRPELVKVGNKVYSKAYGKGTVTEIKGTGKTAVVTVRLADTGDSKKFLLANAMEKGQLVLRAT